MRNISNSTLLAFEDSFKGDFTRFVNNYTLPWACVYAIIFFTNSRDFSKYLDIPPNYFNIGVSGGGYMSNHVFSVDVEKDSILHDMIDYVANNEREESLIIKESFQNRYHMLVVPFLEMFSQRRGEDEGNIVNLELNFTTKYKPDANTTMHVIFIKDTELN